MHFHRWMQNVLLLVLSRMIIFQDPREKTYQPDLEQNSNLHITEGYLTLETSRPAVNEKMLHTQYRGWWLCKAIHMAKVQYRVCLTNTLQTVWRMLSTRGGHSDLLSSWRVLLRYIPHFDHVQVIQLNSKLRLVYFKSLHAIRELVCVCVRVCDSS